MGSFVRRASALEMVERKMTQKMPQQHLSFQTKQNKTKQNKTKQNKTKQNKTKQNKTNIVKLLIEGRPPYCLINLAHVQPRCHGSI